MLFYTFVAVGTLPYSHQIHAESSLSSDEQVIFFPTIAYYNQDKKVWQAPIHAWVYEEERSIFRLRAIESAFKNQFDLRVSDTSRDIFDYRVHLFLRDNERGKALEIRIGEKLYRLPNTSKNGHAIHEVELSEDTVVSLQKDGVVPFSLSGSRIPQKVGKIFIPSRNGISIISDIDDTIKLSWVRDKKKLLKSTFYDPFEAAPEIAGLYKDLLGTATPPLVHYVSSSPWHLYEPLESFRLKEGFPSGQFYLKSFRFKDPSFLNLFAPGTVTKPQVISSILKRFPEQKFILVGDSGEHDPEIYGEIIRLNPSQIEKILIRRVSGESQSDERYLRAFHDVPTSKWETFAQVEELRENEKVPALKQGTLSSMQRF